MHFCLFVTVFAGLGRSAPENSSASLSASFSVCFCLIVVCIMGVEGPGGVVTDVSRSCSIFYFSASLLVQVLQLSLQFAGLGLHLFKYLVRESRFSQSIFDPCCIMFAQYVIFCFIPKSQ